MTGHLPRWIVLRLLGVCLVAAAISLWVQVHGLVGEGGIVPAQETLDRSAGWFAQRDLSRWANMPTLGWWGAGDTALHVLCGLATAAGVLLTIGFAPRLMLLCGWACYLSLFHLGGPFLSFQWDILLIECLLVAIPYAPAGWWPRLATEDRPSRVAVWLVRLLLFKLILASGVVKLTSGDPSWHDLTAMDFHYWTQPLPHALAWYAHDAGPWMRALSVSATFAVELFAPLLILCLVRGWRLLVFLAAVVGVGLAVEGRFALIHLPILAALAAVLDDRLLARVRPRWIKEARDARTGAFWAICGLMIAISATGSYGFFQLLTVALCFSLLDDRALRWLPKIAAPSVSLMPSRGTRWLSLGFAVVILPVGALQATRTAGRTTLREARAAVAADTATPAQIWLDRAQRVRQSVLGVTRPFASINSYGLFATMTKKRVEIAIEGSANGRSGWAPYVFRYKPEDPLRVGAFAGLHMPRLDWQMWFAALRPRCRNDWYPAFVKALLEAKPDVLALLADTPFPKAPPRAIRSLKRDFRFTDAATRAETGRVWRIEAAGVYCPTLTPQAFSRPGGP